MILANSGLTQGKDIPILRDKGESLRLRLAKQLDEDTCPLTTNDDYSRHQNSAACYQLVQSVLKIGSALAERVGQGEVGRSTALAGNAWQLLQLAIERAWSMLDGPFFCFLVQTSVVHLSPCRDSISGFLGSFQSGGAFSGRRALTIVCSVISGCGQGHEPVKNF